MKYKFTSFFIFIIVSLTAQTSLTIPQIQGSSSSSAYVNQTVKTSGIVTAKYIGTGKVGGYFIQDAQGDGNSATSDGIFVATSTENVSVGDKVEVTGTVTENAGRTQLGTLTKTSILSSNNTLPAIKVKYTADNWNWEQYEGMLLDFDQTLFVTNNSSLQQYGQLSLYPSRRYSPTNQYLPGSSDYTNAVAENAKAAITLDDGISTTNYTPIVFADASGTRRTGERVTHLMAVVDYSSSRYMVYPTQTPAFWGNPRPTAPTGLGNYNLKVCAANLEYYLVNTYDPTYGPANVDQETKQHTKIMAMLQAIDADIYGLIEIQQGQDALNKLVTSLNATTVANRYAYINDGGSVYGTYTKVGYIYRTDKVAPYLNLSNNNSPSPLYRKKSQAFKLLSNNEKFIFSLNHYKAKSGCSSATGTDADQGDGQSCYNATRVAEATSTLSFINTNKTYYGDNDVLLMGDLNAYGKEDPVQTLIQGGLVDLHRAFHADSAYSYVYNGEAGYLDNVLASPTMRTQVTGVSVFHVNADEPAMFEYAGTNYQSNMYRCSDHDPVVVGLSLGNVSPVNTVDANQPQVFVNGTTNDIVVKNVIGKAIRIFSIDGQLLSERKAISDETTISTSTLHLKSGIYLIQVSGQPGITKIIL